MSPCLCALRWDSYGIAPHKGCGEKWTDTLMGYGYVYNTSPTRETHYFLLVNIDSNPEIFFSKPEP